MTTAEMLQDLQNNPGYFLKYYPLNLAGINSGLKANQANSRRFHVFKKDEPGDKPGHLGATRPGRVLPFVTHDISSFSIAPGDAGGTPFDALVVPMIYYDQLPVVSGAANIGALDAYLLDDTRNIMITGQLSGCCFCIVPNGADLACIHLNPRGSEGAIPMQASLSANGKFANYPGRFETFGRQDYQAHAIVIGVRVGGVWKIYAQQSDDLFRTITRADRIYPLPKTAL